VESSRAVFLDRMTVTEFAILHLKSADIGPEMLDDAKHSLNVQNEWHTHNYPHLPNTLAGRASLMLQQIEDPTRLLVTAEWESVESHFHWIGSEENKSVMATVSSYLADDHAAELDLSHIDGTFFDTTTLGGSIISIERFFVNQKSKDRFESKLRDIIKKLPDMKGGWRVDGKPGKLEYVIVSNWESVESHDRYISLHAVPDTIKDVAETKTKHYRRVV